jgi:predicted nucleic acid-binding protein
LPRRRVLRAPPKRAFVDSGAWLALASADDARHAAADAVIRQAARARTKLVTTNLVLSEVHAFLLFRVGVRAAIAALAHIEASRLVAIAFATPAHHGAAVAWLRQLADHAISYSDAVSFAVMDATRCETAIGFDAHFVVAGFRLWDAPVG